MNNVLFSKINILPNEIGSITNAKLEGRLKRVLIDLHRNDNSMNVLQNYGVFNDEKRGVGVANFEFKGNKYQLCCSLDEISLNNLKTGENIFYEGKLKNNKKIEKAINCLLKEYHALPKDLVFKEEKQTSNIENNSISHDPLLSPIVDHYAKSLKIIRGDLIQVSDEKGLLEFSVCKKGQVRAFRDGKRVHTFLGSCPNSVFSELRNIGSYL